MTTLNPLIRFYAATETLERKENQDFWLADPEQHLYLVADGMGGYGGGSLASQLTAKWARQIIQTVDSPNFSAEEQTESPSGIPVTNNYEVILRNLVEQIHQELLQEGKKAGFPGMGCTLVLLIFKSSRLYILNVGDSPCYRYSEETLIRLTRSHSKVDRLLREGKITKAQARVHAERNVVSSSVGGQKSPARVDIQILPYYENDRFLLCTDGVTKILTDEQLETFLKRKNSQKAIEEMLEAIEAAPPEFHPVTGLVRKKDNATAMIVDVIGLGKTVTKPGEETLL